MAAHVLNDLVVINCTSPKVDPNNECIHILTSIGRHHTTVKQVISSHIHRVYTSTFNKWFLSNFFDVDTSHIIEVPVKKKKRVTVKGQSLCFEFFDSNHCPGSVMVLLKGSFGSYLYTGNCRYSPEMLYISPLRPYCNGSQKLDKLFVNAAYQQLSRNFPSREVVTRRLLSFIRKHSNEIIYICCRLLGKEDVLVRIATELDVKICLSQDKLKVMRKLGYNIGLFVTEQQQTHIRVVGIEDMSWLKMKRRRETEKCVAIVLTGMEADKHKLKKYGIYIFPLSDHNSADETNLMTSCIKSKEVIYLNVNNSSKNSKEGPKVIQLESSRGEEKSSSESSERRIFFEIGSANSGNKGDNKGDNKGNSLGSMSSISFRISRTSSEGEGESISHSGKKPDSLGSVSLVEGSEEAVKQASTDQTKMGSWGSISSIQTPSSMELTEIVVTGKGGKSLSADDEQSSSQNMIPVKQGKRKGFQKISSSIDAPSSMELTESYPSGKENRGLDKSVPRQKQTSGQKRKSSLKNGKKKSSWGSISSIEPPSAMELTDIDPSRIENRTTGLSVACDEQDRAQNEISVKQGKTVWGSISSIEAPSAMELTDTIHSRKEDRSGCVEQTNAQKEKSIRDKESLGSIASLEAPSGIELTTYVDISSEGRKERTDGQGESTWTTAVSHQSRSLSTLGAGRKIEQWTSAVSKSSCFHSSSGKWKRSITYGSMSVFSGFDASEESLSVSPVSFGHERTEVSPTPESGELESCEPVCPVERIVEEFRQSSPRSEDSVPELPTIVEALPVVEDLPPVRDHDVWSMPSSPECPPGPSASLMELTRCCSQVALESDSSPPSSAEKQPSPPIIVPGLPFNHKIYEQFRSSCPHLWPSLKSIKK